MKIGNNFKTTMGVIIALILAFIIFSSTTLQYLEQSYTTVGYCQSNSSSLVSCSDCNNTDVESQGYKTAKDTCYAVIPTNNTYCWGCGNWGYRDVSRGLQLLIFTIAMIGTAVALLKIRKVI